MLKKSMQHSTKKNYCSIVFLGFSKFVNFIDIIIFRFIFIFRIIFIPHFFHHLTFPFGITRPMQISITNKRFRSEMKLKKKQLVKSKNFCDYLKIKTREIKIFLWLFKIKTREIKRAANLEWTRPSSSPNSSSSSDSSEADDPISRFPWRIWNLSKSKSKPSSR